MFDLFFIHFIRLIFDTKILSNLYFCSPRNLHNYDIYDSYKLYKSYISYMCHIT